LTSRVREASPATSGPQLLLLHALPLDGSMWAAQMNILPGSTYAPDLYALGDKVEAWAARLLQEQRAIA
jgi:pimeloyl-ACP methyl ester carboxylesterase